MDYDLIVEESSPGSNQKLDDLLFQLKSKVADERIESKREFYEILDFLEKSVVSGKDPYLKIEFSGSLRIRTIQKIYRLLEPLIAASALRIEPNPLHLFYQAFLPPSDWKKSSDRPNEIAEIHLASTASSEEITGFIRCPYTSIPISSMPSNNENAEFKNVQQLKEKLTLHSGRNGGVAFIIVSHEARYQSVREIYQEIRAQFPVVYIFSED